MMSYSLQERGNHISGGVPNSNSYNNWNLLNYNGFLNSNSNNNNSFPTNNIGLINSNNSTSNTNSTVVDNLDYRNKVIGTLPPQQSVQFSHQKLLQQQQQQIYLQKQKQYLLQQQIHFQTTNDQIIGSSIGNQNQTNILKNQVQQQSIPQQQQQQFNNSLDYDDMINRFKGLNGSSSTTPMSNSSNQINFRTNQVLLSNNGVVQLQPQTKYNTSNNSNNAIINNNNNFVNNNGNNSIYSENILNNSSGSSHSSPSLGLGPLSPSSMGQLFSISQLGVPSNILNSSNSSNTSGSNDFNSFDSFNFTAPQQNFYSTSSNIQQSPKQNPQLVPSPQIRQGSNILPPQYLLDQALNIYQQQQQQLQNPSIPEPILLSNSNQSSKSPSPQSITKPPSPEPQSPIINLEAVAAIPSNNLSNSSNTIKNTTSEVIYTNNYLDETNFPSLGNNKDLRKSQNSNTSNTNNNNSPVIDSKKDELRVSKNSTSNINRKPKPLETKEPISLNSSNEMTEKVKLSWFEFQTLNSLNTSGETSDSEDPSRILWVGNIGLDVTEEELKNEFGEFGELESVRILHDRYCAFVNFKDTADASLAKKHMHNQVIGSQYIVVNYRHTKSSDELVNAAVPITTPETLNTLSRAIYIGNVSENLPEKEIRKECEKYGEIESIRILRKKACAFVNFMNIQNATNALQSLNGKKLGDSIVRVNYGKPQPPVDKSHK